MSVRHWIMIKLYIYSPEEFENGDFTLKTHHMFSVHTWKEKFENGRFTLKVLQMNLKTEVSLEKRIKCFPLSTLRRRNWKSHQLSIILDLFLREIKEII